MAPVTVAATIGIVRPQLLSKGIAELDEQGRIMERRFDRKKQVSLNSKKRYAVFAA